MINEDIFKSIYIDELDFIGDSLNETIVKHDEVIGYDIGELVLRLVKKKVHLLVYPIKQIRDIQYMNDFNKINKISQQPLP